MSDEDLNHYNELSKVAKTPGNNGRNWGSYLSGEDVLAALKVLSDRKPNERLD